jgi:hypothetical protein
MHVAIEVTEVPCTSCHTIALKETVIFVLDPKFARLSKVNDATLAEGDSITQIVFQPVTSDIQLNNALVSDPSDIAIHVETAEKQDVLTAQLEKAVQSSCTYSDEISDLETRKELTGLAGFNTNADISVGKKTSLESFEDAQDMTREKNQTTEYANSAYVEDDSIINAVETCSNDVVPDEQISAENAAGQEAEESVDSHSVTVVTMVEGGTSESFGATSVVVTDDTVVDAEPTRSNASLSVELSMSEGGTPEPSTAPSTKLDASESCTVINVETVAEGEPAKSNDCLSAADVKETCTTGTGMDERRSLMMRTGMYHDTVTNDGSLKSPLHGENQATGSDEGSECTTSSKLLVSASIGENTEVQSAGNKGKMVYSRSVKDSTVKSKSVQSLAVDGSNVAADVNEPVTSAKDSNEVEKTTGKKKKKKKGKGKKDPESNRPSDDTDNGKSTLEGEKIEQLPQCNDTTNIDQVIKKPPVSASGDKAAQVAAHAGVDNSGVNDGNSATLNKVTNTSNTGQEPGRNESQVGSSQL